ncbi:uncharacterized protein LOC130729577 [Lotus japonicus]|uniref:uncharacterized protein LOC130729577 n=1 Tax=Lotus japonicus TaxID=34305 RepID=UPI00258BCC53|nr:uncharacterized protein LOC130729577 [Lotus japonicus]
MHHPSSVAISFPTTSAIQILNHSVSLDLGTWKKASPVVHGPDPPPPTPLIEERREAERKEEEGIRRRRRIKHTSHPQKPIKEEEEICWLVVRLVVAQLWRAIVLVLRNCSLVANCCQIQIIRLISFSRLSYWCLLFNPGYLQL